MCHPHMPCPFLAMPSGFSLHPSPQVLLKHSVLPLLHLTLMLAFTPGSDPLPSPCDGVFGRCPPGVSASTSAGWGNTRSAEHESVMFLGTSRVPEPCQALCLSTRALFQPACVCFLAPAPWRKTCVPSNVSTLASCSGWVWWHTPVIPELRRRRQKAQESAANLSYIVRACLKQ